MGIADIMNVTFIKGKCKEGGRDMDVNVSRISKLYADYAPKRVGAVKNGKVQGTSGDMVNVSSAAADYQFARRALDNVADIREDRVNAAIQMYSSNASVNANAVAEKIFSNLI